MGWFRPHDESDEEPFNACTELAVIDEAVDNQCMACPDFDGAIDFEDNIIINDNESLVSSLNQLGASGTFDDSVGSDDHPNEDKWDNASAKGSIILSHHIDDDAESNNLRAATLRSWRSGKGLKRAPRAGNSSSSGIFWAAKPTKDPSPELTEQPAPEIPVADTNATVPKRKVRPVPLFCAGVGIGALICIAAVLLVLYLLKPELLGLSNGESGASNLQSAATTQPAAPSTPTKAPVSAPTFAAAPPPPVKAPLARTASPSDSSAAPSVSASSSPTASTAPTFAPTTVAPTATPTASTVAPTAKTSSPTATPTAPTLFPSVTPSPTSAPTSLFKRYANLILQHESPDVFLNRATPQGKAFARLVSAEQLATPLSNARFLQRYALMSMFLATNPYHWFQAYGWSTISASECEWYGIAGCNPLANGDLIVSNIQLASNGLSGTIPTEICLLRRLQQLDMSGNALTGTIPKCLGQLANMTALSLQKNNLTGSVNSAICDLQLTTLTTDCLGSVQCDCCTECSR